MDVVEAGAFRLAGEWANPAPVDRRSARHPRPSPRVMELRTSRLLLRPWRDADLPAYAALNADKQVRRWFPGALTRARSDDEAARLQRHIEAHGFGFWAVEVPGVAPFIGFVGLKWVSFAAPFAPAVEAGWRLAREHWGKGYAAEAAEAALAHGFGPLGLTEIVAFAVPGNLASRRVMERVGMRHDPAGDFDHPAVPEGHPFRRHVLYRAEREHVRAHPGGGRPARSPAPTPPGAGEGHGPASGRGQ